MNKMLLTLSACFFISQYIICFRAMAEESSSREFSYFVDPRDIRQDLKKGSKELDQLLHEKKNTNSKDTEKREEIEQAAHDIYSTIRSLNSAINTYKQQKPFIKRLIQETLSTEEKREKEAALYKEKIIASLTENQENQEKIEKCMSKINELNTIEDEKKLYFYHKALPKNLTFTEYIKCNTDITIRIQSIQEKLSLLNIIKSK